MSVLSPVLVADIGGTNARFALARPVSGVPELFHVRRYKAAEFPSFADALGQYRQEVGREAQQVRRAVFAVATAIRGDLVSLTNSPWRFSIEDVRRAFGLDCLAVINDFEAIGHAIPHLKASALAPVGPEEFPPLLPGATATCAVLGPGTGLGVCLLRVERGRALVLPSEAGHIGFAPADALEMEVLRVLQRQHGRVSNERLVSGPGLAALHDALCEVEGGLPPRLSPEAITAAAARAPGGPESRTLRLFCALYGAVAGDMVLAFAAWQGALLVGRLSNLLLPALRGGGFRQRFEGKGRFETVLKTVSTSVVTESHPGLMGAAAYAAWALGNADETG